MFLSYGDPAPCHRYIRLYTRGYSELLNCYKTILQLYIKETYGTRLSDICLNLDACATIQFFYNTLIQMKTVTNRDLH